MKKYSFILLFLLGCLKVQSQSYQVAAGLRLGGGVGISIQSLLSRQLSIETQLRHRPSLDYTELALLVKDHHKFAFRRFNMYVGGGMFSGWYSREVPSENSSADWGVSLIAGLEVTVGKLNLSVDLRPDINLSGGGQVLSVHSGIGIRTVLVRRKKKPLRLQIPFLPARNKPVDKE